MLYTSPGRMNARVHSSWNRSKLDQSNLKKYIELFRYRYQYQKFLLRYCRVGDALTRYYPMTSSLTTLAENNKSGVMLRSLMVSGAKSEWETHHLHPTCVRATKSEKHGCIDASMILFAFHLPTIQYFEVSWFPQDSRRFPHPANYG